MFIGQGLRPLPYFEVAMSTKTAIANKAMLDLGEALFTDVDADGTNPANVVNAAWDIILPEALNHGPEDGWKFAVRTFSCISRDSATITAFTSASSTTTTVTASHTLIAGDRVEIAGTTSYDGTFQVVSVSTTVSFVITTDFVADDATGTAKWTSDSFAYRYARPTSTRVTKVKVAGVELSDWIREGEFILTNQEDTEVDMSYIQDASVVVITNFPPHFVDVLWRRLSACLAYDLVQNQSLSNAKLTTLEQIYIPRAIGMDNREQFVQEFSNSWQTAGHSTGIEGDFPHNPLPTIFKR
jgi:hypothetical protein